MDAIIESSDKLPINFVKKGWVIAEGQHPEIARIREVYWDSICKEWIMDIVIYTADGERIGRSSPACGGPTYFEPAVPCKYWTPIQAPQFPLERDSTGFRDWRESVVILEAAES